MAVELGEYARNVCFGGERADHQPARDIGVAESGGDQLEDLALALGELVDLGGGCLRVRAGGELGNQPPRDRGREQRVAGGDDSDRLQQLVRAGVFEQKGARARAERGVDVLVEVEGGEHEHARLGERRVGAQQPGCFQAVEDGHADVHQHDVWEGSACEVDGFPAVAGFADDLHLLLGRDQCGEAGADGGLVVGDEDPGHAPRR